MPTETALFQTILTEPTHQSFQTGPKYEIYKKKTFFQRKIVKILHFPILDQFTRKWTADRLNSESFKNLIYSVVNQPTRQK